MLLLLCVWSANTSWFIPLGECNEVTDRTSKEISKHIDISSDDVQQQWHGRQNLFTQQRHHLSDKENQHISVSQSRSVSSISLQVLLQTWIGSRLLRIGKAPASPHCVQFVHSLCCEVPLLGSADTARITVSKPTLCGQYIVWTNCVTDCGQVTRVDCQAVC